MPPRRLSLVFVQVPADVKDKVQFKVDSLKEAIATDDAAKIKAAMEAVQQEAMAMGQAMYGQQQQQQQPGGGAEGQQQGQPGGSKPDDVIDAEFTDKQ